MQRPAPTPIAPTFYANACTYSHETELSEFVLPK